MANHKRRKCRYHQSPHTSTTFMRKRGGLTPYKLPQQWWKLDFKIDWGDGSKGRKYNWGYPRWHDILYHHRPRRRAEARCLNAVRQGSDPEDMAWPLSKKSHRYYW